MWQKSTHTIEYKLLTDLLIEERKKAGLTQIDLAERIGRPQKFVSKFETGQRRLDIVEFIWITEAIGADPVTLFKTVAALNRSKRRAKI